MQAIFAQYDSGSCCRSVTEIEIKSSKFNPCLQRQTIKNSFIENRNKMIERRRFRKNSSSNCHDTKTDRCQTKYDFGNIFEFKDINEHLKSVSVNCNPTF